MIPTLPLRLRNRLAEVILAALHDPRARAELRALARSPAPPWLEDGEAAWAPPLAERARRASDALGDRELVGADAPLPEVLEAAASLFDAGLYFEVHELLEPYWCGADGDLREALQGLIQAAVGYQHLANGNPAGARALLEEGSGRLHGRSLGPIDLEPFALGVATSIDRLLPGGRPAAAIDRGLVPRFPRGRG